MKIIVTADLHLPITSRSTIQNLVLDIQKQAPDVVVLAGDIGETLTEPDYFQQCVELFTAALDCPVLVLAGNHDLWVHDSSPIDSMEMWTTELPAQAKQANSQWLEGQNYVHKGIAIVGSMLHYDFSAKDTVGPASQLGIDYFIANKKSIINDGRFFRGLPDDITFSKQIGDAFRKRLVAAQMDPDVHEIIVTTHVPCTEPQITRLPQDFGWTQSTPFFGNLSHEDWFIECSKISHIVSAHSHRANRGELRARDTMGFDDPSLREELRAAGLRSKFKSSDPVTITLGSDYRNPSYEIIESVVQ